MQGRRPPIAPSLLHPLSNTSHITIPFRQLIIQILGCMIIGIGAFKPLREMVVVVLLRFLFAERLHNALLSPISFYHRLQPFLYYFHNSLEIKRFFPLNLFQKCFPANYTCCVCRKTFCKQLQFGIVYKPSITEKYNIFLKSGNILRNIFKNAVEYYRIYPCFIPRDDSYL